MTISALNVAALCVRRGERRLFDAFDLHVRAGDAIALTGANGSGKTSLLRAVAGLLRPESGAITFLGEGGGALDADEARSDQIHLIGHQDGLKSSRTAGEELQFQAAWTGGGPGAVDRAVEALGLKPLLDLEVRRLSAGQRRRVALGRLIASPRSLWLLDEPMAPLDAARRALLAELMQAHLAGGGLLIAAVHDPLPFAARAVEVGA
jgi:heme exporter protein A